MSSIVPRFLQKITQVRPSWRHSNIQFKQITCALSNKVFCVSNGDDKLLLRIYGSSDHGLFTRDQEVRQTCRLSSLGFGASVLSTFEEGRIESWIDGSTPSHRFMKSAVAIPVIARKLRKLHDDTGLNHNDLHHNNMLFTKDGGVEFLDFEYSGDVDPTYDIANHFNEWMYPYTGPNPHLFKVELYPSLAQRRLFCESYLGNTAGKGPIVDDFLEQVERRRQDSHEFWIRWAERQPSEFNDLYASARRTLLTNRALPKAMCDQSEITLSQVSQAQGLLDLPISAAPAALGALLKKPQRSTTTVGAAALA